MKNLCKDCAAYSAMTKECRRHAPVMVPVPQADPVSGRQVGVAAMGLYPATREENWCLEFERDERVLQ